MEDVWLAETKLYSPVWDMPNAELMRIISPSNNLIVSLLANMCSICHDPDSVRRFITTAFGLLETANAMAEDKPFAISEISSVACVRAICEITDQTSDTYTRQQMVRIFFENRWYYRFVDRAVYRAISDRKLTELHGVLLYRFYEIQAELDLVSLA